MLATEVTAPDLRALSDTELADAFSAGAIDLATLTAESDRRDATERKRQQRAGKVRAASRERNAEWEAAAYAQYLAADARCRGFLLSEAGKRTGRDPWPMLWEGSRETADKLASDDLLTFWDYESPRVPGPRAYAAAKREAAAEQAARNAPPAPSATPSARQLAEQAATAPRPAPRPPAPSARDLAEQAASRPAGSIARYITALGHLQRQADKTARALARVNGGIR